MRILDRYILRSVLALFFSCIFIFLFLYVIIDTLSHLEDILKQHITLVFLLKYYLTYLPIMLAQVSPFACLLSVLYTFGKLNHNNEIIAMRSSGQSIFQMTKTVIIMGFVVSLFVFWVNDRVVPRSLLENQKMKSQIEEGTKKAREKKQEDLYNLSMYGSGNKLYFVNRFSVKDNSLYGITILEHDQHQNITRKIVANRGVYKDKRWKFYQCITYNFDENGQIIEEPVYLEEEAMDIPEGPRDFINQRQRVDFMTIAQLSDYIRKLSKSGASTVIRNLKLELYQRFTSPFTNLLIIMVGIPFALIIRKRATGLSSIGISIMVGFLYYILDAISIALGMGGILTPVLSASLSHISVLVFSTYLIAKLP